MTEAVMEAKSEQVRRNAPRPTPFRAMLWKEWRESWWLLIPTLVGPGILVAVICSDSAAWKLWAVIPLLFFCLLPGLLGARLFAAETARGTAFFQLERPVHRALIWKVRVLMPLIFIGVGVVAPLILFARYSLWQSMDGIACLPGLMLLIFSATMLCSILMDRPVTALAAGGVVAFAGVLLCGMPVELLWEQGIRTHFLDGYTTSGFTYSALIGMGLLVVGVLLLILGRWTYVRQDLK
jgi:hypothetical protein